MSIPEHELQVAAWYLELRGDPLSASTLTAEHFADGRVQDWWTKALSIGSGWTREDLGLGYGPHDIDLGAHVPFRSMVPDLEARVKTGWVYRRARQAASQFIDSASPETLSRDVEELMAGVTEAMAGGPSRSVTLCQAGQDAFTAWRQALVEKEPSVIPVPWKALENRVGGLLRGKLVLIGGRSSEHKTTVARALGWHAAKSGTRVLYWTMEDSSADIAARTIASENDCLAFSHLMTGTSPRLDEISLRRSMGQAVSTLEKRAAGLFRIVEDANPRLAQIVATIRAEVAKHRIGLVILDFVQLVTPNADNERVSVEWWRRVIAELSGLAKALKISIVATSQIEKVGTQASELEKRLPHAMEMPFGSVLRQGAFAVVMVGLSAEEQWRGRLLFAIDKWKSAGKSTDAESRFSLAVYPSQDRLEQDNRTEERKTDGRKNNASDHRRSQGPGVRHWSDRENGEQ